MGYFGKPLRYHWGDQHVSIYIYILKLSHLMMISYPILYIGEGRSLINGKANQNDISLGIRERSQSVVVFLACSIPQRQLDRLVIELNTCNIILKYSGNITLLSMSKRNPSSFPIPPKVIFFTSGKAPLL